MSTYFFSGVNRPFHMRLLAEENGAGMVNVLTKNQNLEKSYTQYNRVLLALDSGAYQLNTNLEDYARKVRSGDRFLWKSNLDVLKNQYQSDLNWEALLRAGAETIWIYQVEGGRSLDYLQERAERHSFLGVGGLVPVLLRDMPEAIDLIARIGERLQAVGASGHFFGVGSPSILMRYAGQPWFRSADSVNWLAGIKYHQIIRRDGSRVSVDKLGFALTGEECTRQNIRQTIRWMRAEAVQMTLFDMAN